MAINKQDEETRQAEDAEAPVQVCYFLQWRSLKRICA